LKTRRLLGLILGAAVLIGGANWLYASRYRPGVETLPAPVPLRLARRDLKAALSEIDGSIKTLNERTASQYGDWFDQESLTTAYQARFRLTGDYRDLAAAQAAADKGIAMAVKGSGPLLARAGVLLTSHKTAAAEADLAAVDRFVVPDYSTRAEAKAMRGDIAFSRGLYAEASKLFDEAGQIERWTGLPYRRANLASQLGDFDTARTQLNSANTMNRAPTPAFRADMLTRAGEFDLAQGKWPEASARFAEANRVFPGYWRIEMRVAQMQALGGQTAPAILAFERIAAASGSPEAMDVLAGLYRSQGNRSASEAWAAKAGAVWKERLRLLPEAAWGHGAEHELAFGDPRLALKMAGSNARNRPHGAPLILLAKAWLANGRADYALALCQKVAQSGWVSVDQWLTRAEALVLLGRGDEALDARAEAEKLNPHALGRNPAFVWLDH
jgi:tetratricopeptide (TPR) repeat protein